MLMPTILKSFVSDDAGVAVAIVVCKGSHAAQTPVMNFSQTSGNFSQTSGNFSMASEGLNVGFITWAGSQRVVSDVQLAWLDPPVSVGMVPIRHASEARAKKKQR